MSFSILYPHSYVVSSSHLPLSALLIMYSLVSIHFPKKQMNCQPQKIFLCRQMAISWRSTIKLTSTFLVQIKAGIISTILKTSSYYKSSHLHSLKMRNLTIPLKMIILFSFNDQVPFYPSQINYVTLSSKICKWNFPASQILFFTTWKESCLTLCFQEKLKLFKTYLKRSEVHLVYLYAIMLSRHIC